MPSVRLTALARDLLPPLVFRALARVRAHAEPTEPVVGREQSADFYDRSFLEHDHWRKHYSESHYYPVWAVLADRVYRSGVRSVVDIGCGPGQVAALLRDRGLLRYHGIDFSPRRIEQARAVCPEFDFTSGDVFASDLLSTLHYDAVLCTEFLEHVDRDLELLARIKPGTRCFCTVPNFGAMQHVRHFEDVGEVRARYGARLAELDVVEHRASAQGKKFFLMEGVTTRASGPS